MAEIPSDVFDILYPSPVSLKKLSAIAVSLETWRREVNKFRRNCELEKYNPFKQLNSSKTVFPDLPSTLYGLIDEYVIRLGSSMAVWLRAHFTEGFYLHYSDENDVLNDFDDFVCDYDGTIDYVKTGERMMRCDRFDADIKFVVACIYFLEDDIRRFWPLVCEKIDLDAIEFYSSPQFCDYWIRCLKNELDEIPFGTYNDNETLDEEMLDKCMYLKYGNRRCLEYFWNRIPSEKQMQKAEDLIVFHDDLFTRYILPKLNDQQISQLINTERENLLQKWLENVDYENDQILRLWMRYRNMINARCFEEALSHMLHRSKLPPKRHKRGAIQDESNNSDAKSRHERVYKKRTYLTCEMWNSAPDHLKRSTIHQVLHNGFMFVDTYAPYDAGILLAILPYATFEDRNKFWNSTWPKLICLTRGANLQRMMELCFNTQDEISQFKRNVLAKSDDVENLCVEYYLKGYCFEYVNDLVDFCCLDNVQTARSFKQKLLRSAFLSTQDSSLQLGTSFHIEEFNGFILNAFDSEDQASVFKNDVILSPFFQHILLKMIASQCKKLMQFVDAFVSSKDTLKKIKTQILEAVKQYYLNRKRCGNVLPVEDRDTFLLWCLGSKEEISQFERQYFVSDADGSSSE
ncbi:uncharacterized protein LOC135848253 isoform X12 [Planococcus citri]|uniref:uncharacterized protein LOC135848253 isoform X12 n=1 Tax=Planococcus citri TaxID=170843 RepID=UPI0031F81C22